MCPLIDLPRHTDATIREVMAQGAQDPIALRLTELGFVEGEPVRVVAHGPVGGDPVLVQIGYTRFALRRSEAARVQVERTAQQPQARAEDEPHREAA